METRRQWEDGVRRRYAALVGAAAAAAGLGVGELLAGLLPAAASPVIAVGDLVIALQPAGGKQVVVDLFGEADKLVLNLVVVGAALGLGAALGAIGLSRPRGARAGFVIFGLVALVAALRDPLAEPIFSLLTIGVALAAAMGVLQLLPRPAALDRPAAMPDWGRRRILGGSLAIGALAVTSGTVGRLLLEGRSAAAPPPASIPDPVGPVPELPDGASLDVSGITPIVTPNDSFYRIDTALLVPRPDVSRWRLRVTGMVDRPLELSYQELLALPLHAQYVTIACVSNEVGGDLVGNALWTGVRLRELLDRAGVQPDASQIVGRSVDRWTAGFPTEWALADHREAMVAVTMNGEPLPPRHGYPARLIVPGLYGYVSATKWLEEIELTTLEAFDAYWVPLGWAKEAPILTQSRIDLPAGGATLEPGPVVMAGVAWAPDRGIRAVEVQIDDGRWLESEVSTPISDATWVQWTHRWDASPGEHRLRVRATDGSGEVQTSAVTRPPPDGARGLHTIRVRVG